MTDQYNCNTDQRDYVFYIRILLLLLSLHLNASNSFIHSRFVYSKTISYTFKNYRRQIHSCSCRLLIITQTGCGYSGSVLNGWSTGRAIDPAPGA